MKVEQEIIQEGFENNLDKTEVKVEQEIIQEGFENTYFKPIYRSYTQFECEKPLVWSMKQTCNITRNGDIEYHYLYSNPVEIKNNLNILKK